MMLRVSSFARLSSKNCCLSAGVKLVQWGELKPDIDAYVTDYLKHQNKSVAGLWHNGVAVGYLMVSHGYQCSFSRNVIEITGLYVEPEYRPFNLKGLLGALTAYDKTAMISWSIPDNPKLERYLLRFGFKKAETRYILKED